MKQTDYNSTAPSQIAWAYLRRNREYQKDAHNFAAGIQVGPEQEMFPCVQQTQSDVSAKKWGLLAYADPGEHRIPFWHPDKSKITVVAEARNAGEKTSTPPFIPMVRKAKAEVRGLLLSDGRLCLNVVLEDSLMQLMFPSGTTFEDDTPVTLILPFGLDLPVQAEKAKVLWSLLNEKVKKSPAIAPTPL